MIDGIWGSISGTGGTPADPIAADSRTNPFAVAVGATRMPMAISDPRLPDNPLVFVNDAFCRLTGYSRDEVVGRNCRFLQGPNTDLESVDRLRAAVAAAQPIEIDLQNHRKSGEPFWNRLFLAPVRDADGAVTYFCASQVDVTSERQRLTVLEADNAALLAEVAERLRAQQESEARLRFATQAGRLGIWELDLRSGELISSSLCRTNFGRDANAPFSYADWHRAIHADDRPMVATALQRSIAAGTDYDLEYRVLRPDGTVSWVQVRAEVARDSAGTPLRMAGVCLDTTTRRTAELRLEASEESLRLGTEAAEVGTWDLDVVRDVLTWSDRTRKMFGVAAGTPGSKQEFFACLHPDDWAVTTGALEAAFDPGRRAPYDVEYRTIGRDDGIVRWVAAKGRALFDDQGKCVRALGTVTDITARKATEERLRLSESTLARTVATLDALLANAPIGFAFFDHAHRYVRLNDTLAAINGLPIDAHLGQTLEAALPSIAPMIGPAIDAVLATGESVPVLEVDGETPAHPGETRSWLTSVFPVFGPAGEILYAGNTVIDITGRRRAEAAVKDLNQTLEAKVAERTAERDAAWNNTQDLLLVLDGASIIRAANPAWRRLLGWLPEDLLGRSIVDFIHPDEQQASRNVLAAAGPGALWNKERRLRHQDGSWHWIAWLISREGPLAYASGRDVTAEKEAAALLASTEEQLRQAQKMEAVGQLTGGIAHDFNNLLAGIIGSLELLQRRLESGRTDGLERYSKAAITSAERAAALTQRLLAFARRQKLDPRRIDANRLLAGMEDLLRRTLGPGTELKMVLASGLGTTLCDVNQLENAILNLAINARDAMPEGGRLTVETASTQLDDADARGQAGDVKPGPYVAVSVTDTGTGIATDIIGRVFDPFFTTKPIGQGTGLGLSMLYGFVKQSGGHVRIHSELGHGTTFTLYLPRLPGLARDDVEGQAGCGHPDFGARAQETVLVVDDEPTVRMLVVETLEGLGYAAIETADAPAALRVLHSDARVDLMVSDIGLPGLDGRQLAVAARVARPGLRVLFMTGYAPNAAIGNSGEPRAEIISKPFALDALARKVRSMIDEV